MNEKNQKVAMIIGAFVILVVVAGIVLFYLSKNKKVDPTKPDPNQTTTTTTTSTTTAHNGLGDTLSSLIPFF